MKINFFKNNKKSILIVLVLIIISTYFFRTFFSLSEYRTFYSPHKIYRIVVFRRPVFQFMLPGQSGDAPGIVRLYDHQGNLLYQVKVNLVQSVDRVYWEGKTVHIKCLVEWKLPIADYEL